MHGTIIDGVTDGVRNHCGICIEGVERPAQTTQQTDCAPCDTGYVVMGAGPYICA